MTKGKSKFGQHLFLGVGVAAVAAVAVPAGFWWAWTYRAEQAEIAKQKVMEAEAQESFQPVYDKLKAVPATPQYDIDKTVRVIHEIDLALEQEDDLEGYLRNMARQDYRDVAPEVLESRQELMQILQRLYAKQTEAEDQQAMWEYTSEMLLATLSVVEVSGEANVFGGEGAISVDREQARTLLEQWRAEKEAERQLVKELQGIEAELVDSLVAYADTYYKYIEEWDQLSTLRDRAYLAAHNGDWEAVAANAQLAIDKAPNEKEAHLLRAMALIETDDDENAAEIEQILGDYQEKHPDSNAPALLLLGVHYQRQGRTKEAQLAFQQSAAYYPRQSDQLSDMLDPYKMRSFLRKSREGGFILELYKSTMLGAGYFSPDLQMAKALFDQGDNDGGRAKVLDHFARRRAQQQWDFILSDLKFCHDLLGPNFWEIFPENTYMDLVVSPAMFSDALNLSVNNRSTRALHNATLVLALHYTDMYPNDYHAIAAPQTVPALNAHEETSFGSVNVNYTLNGTDKTLDDIVHHRAILISNEAVTWVDTDEYKISESQEFRERRRAAEATQPTKTQKQVVHPDAKRHPQFQRTADRLFQEAVKTASVEVETKYGSDNVLIELPRELSILRPMFRLQYGDQVYAAEDNLIEGDRIQLRFKGIDNFDGEGIDPNDLELLVASPFGDVALTWKSDGNLHWRLVDMTPQ